MEFRSPGGLLSGISLEQLKNLVRVHDTRNVLVGRTLRELGHMREMGEGILRIFDAMRDSELVDPELHADTDYFSVTLRSQSIFGRQDIDWLESYRQFDLDKSEQRVVLLGRDGHLLSTNEIIKIIGIIDIDDFRALYERLRRKGLLFNARPGGGRTGVQRREIGRFAVRPSNEAEQFLGELLEALRLIGPATVLSNEAITTIRSKLSQGSPYKDNPGVSLQLLGFIDLQRRFLPKALSYVPELEQQASPQRFPGNVLTLKPGLYGFLKGDDDISYFFHRSELVEPANWETLVPGIRVSFIPGPAQSPGKSQVATDIRLV